MIRRSKPCPDAAVERVTSRPSPISRIAGGIRRLCRWLRTKREIWEEANTYDDLRGLSDKELAHRGLSRHTLAHDVGPERTDPKD